MTDIKAATSVATRAAVLTAAALPDGPDRWADAVHATVRSLIHRLTDALLGITPELDYPRSADAETELDTLGPLDGWTVLDIGEIHQELLALELDPGAVPLTTRKAKKSGRDAQGSWYTPEPLAREMSRISLEIAFDGLPEDDPEQVLRLRAVDPACGAGVILLQGARQIATIYARRLAGTDAAPPRLLRKIMPEVIHTCVFGMDIDPVAVDLTRTALWIEVEGRPPFTWLDGNIACLNPLAGPNSLPERLIDVMGEPLLKNAATAGDAT